MKDCCLDNCDFISLTFLFQRESQRPSFYYKFSDYFLKRFLNGARSTLCGLPVDRARDLDKLCASSFAVTVWKETTYE